jgi:hypothetical protein
MVPALFTWVSIIGSLISVAGWSWVFYNAAVNNIALYWLPLAPVCGLAVAYYVDGDISSLAADMISLESKKYDVKDV